MDRGPKPPPFGRKGTENKRVFGGNQAEKPPETAASLTAKRIEELKEAHRADRVFVELLQRYEKLIEAIEMYGQHPSDEQDLDKLVVTINEELAKRA